MRNYAVGAGFGLMLLVGPVEAAGPQAATVEWALSWSSAGKDLAPLTFAPEGRAVRVGSPIWSCEQRPAFRSKTGADVSETVVIKCQDGQSEMGTLASCTVGAPSEDRALLFVNGAAHSFTLSIACASSVQPRVTSF